MIHVVHVCTHIVYMYRYKRFAYIYYDTRRKYDNEGAQCSYSLVHRNVDIGTQQFKIFSYRTHFVHL